ncbi:MAG: ribosome-associated translation inhibitor RaiA [Cytophagales bacterium]|nr:MAG: ribosome-associated translation inhibitor RaiA [Cytophagales bacterium]TAF60779.1 MAG: ribosome-associated translation inhibitor RaiA [Cytophagales bacterium]
METKVHSIHFKATSELEDFIQQKLKKLEVFYPKIIDAEVFLRLEKTDNPRENKEVVIRLNIPGTTLLAKEIDNSFEAAADSSVEALRRQLRKYKTKQENNN